MGGVGRTRQEGLALRYPDFKAQSSEALLPGSEDSAAAALDRQRTAGQVPRRVRRGRVAPARAARGRAAGRAGWSELWPAPFWHRPRIRPRVSPQAPLRQLLGQLQGDSPHKGTEEGGRVAGAGGSRLGESG